MARKILVTGGAGFIGTNYVIRRLAAFQEDEIVVLDALTYAGNPANLEGVRDSSRFAFVRGNICDQPLVERLIREHDISVIVHFAAESHVDRSIHGPDIFLETNINGTHTLLKAARNLWLAGDGRDNHLFHHVSTDEVYGSLGPGDPPFREDTPYAPNSPYAASKASSDHLVRAYHHTYGLNVTTSNCSNNYGPFQFPEKLIPLVLINILEGRALPIYGDGLNIRDWLYVDDHCRGIDLILDKGIPGQVYNIGGANEWTNIEIVRLICRLLDERFAGSQTLRRDYPAAPGAGGRRAETLITHVEDRPGHDRRYAIDATRSRNELGYRPVESFESGIGLTLDWYLANEPWWREVMSGDYRKWLELNYR